MPKRLLLTSTVITAFLFFFLAVFAAAPARAEENGGDIEFSNTKVLPHVTFSHKLHLDKGNKCEDCHDSIFQKKKGSTDAAKPMTMADINKGAFCGTCHGDNKKAFAPSKNCAKCHIKH